MRHNGKRSSRGRGPINQSNNNNGKKPNRMRVYESNGPDVRIRGTAWQVTEKYEALAKDAESSGKHVLAENYRQHAEHYQRIINTFAEEMSHFPYQEEQNDIDGDVEIISTQVENADQDMAVA